MINAKFFQRENCLTGFSVSGHADYDNSGKDIVCASVSSAVQLASNMITDGFKIKADVSVDNQKISLLVTDSENSENARIVLNSLYQHLTFISEDYKGTINITLSEV